QAQQKRMPTAPTTAILAEGHGFIASRCSKRRARHRARTLEELVDRSWHMVSRVASAYPDPEILQQPAPPSPMGRRARPRPHSNAGSRVNQPDSHHTDAPLHQARDVADSHANADGPTASFRHLETQQTTGQG